MARTAPKTVAILQGNATVAKLMAEFLTDSGSFEVEILSGRPPGAARADLALIDIDSGAVAAEQWIRHCDGRQLPSIVSGVTTSSGAYEDRHWLARPFSAGQLVRRCREVLGLSPTTDSKIDDIPSAIESRKSEHEPPTVEIPGEAGDSPNSEAATSRQSTEELLDVLELEGAGSSMILEVEELSQRQHIGGTLVGCADRRIMKPEELIEDNPWVDEPDTEVDGPGSEPAIAAEPSAPVSVDGGGTDPSARADVTAVSSLQDVASGDLSSAHQVASIVAEHWDRLGLTARPTDRAGRLQRVMSAMLRDGMDGVLDELKRIPPVDGFSGRLETMSVLDLLHTIRDRRLRGRLEVGLSKASFVLYIDRTTLQGIDSLGENTDGMLVELLHNLGALDDRSYRHYQELSGKLQGEPLEMKLRRDDVVSQTQLLEAKKRRASRLLTSMCKSDDGTFAFIEIPHGSGQSWPTQSLSLNVDELVLQILRDRMADDSSLEAASRARLIVDPSRLAGLEMKMLTELEQRVVDVFRDGQTIEDVCEIVGDTGARPVQRVAHRLYQLEVLRPLPEDGGPSSAVASTDEFSDGTVDLEPSDTDDPRQGPTAVKSSWNLEVLDEFDDDADSTTETELPEETTRDVGFSPDSSDE